MQQPLATLFIFVLVSLACGAQGGSIVATDSTWNYFKGFSEASTPDPTAWRSVGFDDSGWLQGRAPFYYENSPGSAYSYTGNTLLGDMFNQYTCIFMRKTFVIASVAEVSELHLDALSDDGFIAWINGHEVVRFNMPAGEVPFDGTSSPALAEPVPPQSEVLSDPASYLVEGTNVIAVQAFNSSLGSSSDFLMQLSLDFVSDTKPPVVANLIPGAGAQVRKLNTIEVDFSESVVGVDASDLLINGAPATNVTQFAPWQYVFDFPPPPTGTVQVAWIANHGIHDLAGAANPFAGGSWTYLLDPNAPEPGIRISEFMADNKRTLHDQDGDSSDWIEIFNPTTSAINLGGWALTDTAQNLMEWRFPNYVLGANSYLLVFASGKNRTNVTGELHTNFQLASGGEFLALVDPSTNIVSSFAPAYPPQQTDVSFGRGRFAPNVVGYFTVPTPGAPNLELGTGFAPEVKFQSSGHPFATPFELALWTSSTNAEIRYTLDGSEPSDTSTVYSGPINITNTVEVRTRAYQSGLLPGLVRSETFIQLNPNLINTATTLPVLVLYNYGAGGVPVSVPQLVNCSIFEPQNGVTSLTNAPKLSVRAGIHVRGSSTLGLPKQSWSMEFWDENGDALNASPLGLPSESDWVLYAPNNFEPVLIHNPLIYRLSNEIGRYAPRTRFVVVYINTTGGPLSSANYNGIYVLEEKIKIGPDRVDINKLQPENNTAPSITGGYQMKIDRPGPGESGFYAAGQGIVYVDPSEAEITTPQRSPQQQYLQSYMDSFGAVLNSPTYRDPNNGYAAYVDIGSWIDHHILNVMSFNVDALRLSAYFYKERNGRLFFGPIWDFDRSQGSTDGRDFNPRIWRSPVGDMGTDFFNYPWWGRMFTDINFWQAWIDRYQALRADLLSTNHIYADIDDLANQVRSEQPREVNRWSFLTQPRSGTSSMSGYSYNFPGTYQGEVNFLKQWYRDRLRFMDTNFLAAPDFSAAGGEVPPGFTFSLSAPPGATIYYTIDGTDPRAPGGVFSPSAQIYTGELTATNNLRIIARSYDVGHRNLTGANNPPLSSPWSGPSTRSFVVTTPRLVVTELMYHPAPPPTGSTNTASDFEYLELKNVGTNDVSLPGISFVKGISFTFGSSGPITTLKPGQVLLLVKNQVAFQSRYPGVTNIAGQYQGSLNNAGERLALAGSVSESIFDFSFKSSWYPITDGLGFSLVVVDENAPAEAWSSKQNWRPSGTVNGSPGYTDPAPPVFPVVIVNEALTHTDPPEVDTVELFNAGTNIADLSGWFLTDDFNQPKKYRFPAGTTLPLGGYLLADETQFNSGAVNSFALSSLGDSIYLFSGDAQTNLTGYFHGFDFGPAKNGVSFGRYLTSEGKEQFVAQVTNSLGQANAGPLVGPVVISEILYDPAPASGTNNDTLDEFIELQNITSQAVPLYDINFPTNAWQVSGGIQLTFPLGLVLPASGQLLLVNFDPIHQPDLLAQFQARYGIAADVQLLGPYSGALGNSDDKVKLYKPDPPEPPISPIPGFVPYVLVDEVDYSASSPWPTNATATGLSIQRINSWSFGNDPINWATALPTPGLPNASVAPSLSIAIFGSNAVLSWPGWAAGFVLKTRGDLSPAGSWSLVGTPAQTVDGRFVLTNQISSTPSFYRLRR